MKQYDILAFENSGGGNAKEDSARRFLLATQHRNTRHAAVDTINEIYNEYRDKYGVVPEVEEMINKIGTAVFNLKQKQPNF